MLSLTRIVMLVKMGAIKFGQPVSVLRKVGGNPVKDHSETSLVATVDKVTELVGIAETAGRGVIASNLVTP